ncbi:MAG TPA: hypothetical protein VGM69_04950 [Chloroflexota bacterium]
MISCGTLNAWTRRPAAAVLLTLLLLAAARASTALAAPLGQAAPTLGVTPTAAGPGETVRVRAAGFAGTPSAGSTACLGLLGPGPSPRPGGPWFQARIGQVALGPAGTGEADVVLPADAVSGLYRVVLGACPPQPDLAPLAAAAEAPLTVVAGTPPEDGRYFPQTGFRIDDDTVWDYFQRRGGVPTFGYPVSRTFLFRGVPVQFFQRRVVEIGPDGNPRQANLLDSELMPYTRINGATFPAADPALIAGAPPATDPVATLQFVQAHAVDVWRNRPVNFRLTFLNTVTYPTAFPRGGGHPNLLPGINLEMWGVPTSDPAYDPNNQGFVYQRWQRGIMHRDAGCDCTQGILLADYLKSIITGRNLPADLDRATRDSRLRDQYQPGSRRWMRDPDLLPGTDLTNAFTPLGAPSGAGALAPIEAVEVRTIAGNPTAYVAHVRFGLSDGCTSPGGYAVARADREVRVTVRLRRTADPGAPCAAVYGMATYDVPLGSDFVAGQAYTLDVNGQRTAFTPR